MFDPAFFVEEERSGYTVSAKMKKIWAAEIDMMERFQQVCHEHGLRCFVCYGTLLGAVRHQGMIPWDDDVDFVMLREDYNKLLDIGPTAFEDPYFFQTVDTDKHYSRGHAQLRNSNTTAMLPNEKGHFSFNQGIFIDIFPLDEVPADPALLQKQRKKVHFYKRILDASVRYPGNPRKNAVKNIVHAFASLLPYRWVYRRMIDACCAYNGTGTGWLAPISFLPDDQRLMPAACFDEVTELPFEHLTVDAPAGYHELLTALYGDYMTPVLNGSYHGTVFFDPDRSYKDYLK